MDCKTTSARKLPPSRICHKCEAENGDEYSASSFKTCLSGIQRGFKEVWGYDLKLLRGPVFRHPKTGLYNVIENKIREQQTKGKTPKEHNYLPESDLIKLLESPELSKANGRTFLTRIFFGLFFNWIQVW